MNTSFQSELISLMRGFIVITPNVFLLIISTYYATKTIAINSALLIVSGLLISFASIFYGIDIFFMFGLGYQTELLYFIVDIIYAIGLIGFGIGIILLINKKITSLKKYSILK
ncbi:hypothetical protein GCM10022393_33330 [Aquimarina addita]|uniref:Multipass membrane protein n=1 Tax=Aquimarina addita TaxID=870485 RepID=A0ABP6USF3_9FLAO